ncbi:MAG: hypothetical protein JF593_10325 [Novosphingobium sp.]|nr:hypothetical protein [Novosphingobium sp.]
MRRLAALASLALLASQPLSAGDPAVGQYRVSEGPDIAGGLWLHADGQFEYGLAAGALDEQAKGRWRRQGESIVLTTTPRPRPPLFRMEPRAAPAAEAPTLLVTWPDGRGVPGVDFRLGFDSGEPIVDYTQETGWTLAPDEHRTPRWIELAVPMHGLVSPRFTLPPGPGTLRFVIVPNDIGTVDFEGTRADIAEDKLVLHRDGGDMHFTRERR